MTYSVFGGTLNLAQSINLTLVSCVLHSNRSLSYESVSFVPLYTVYVFFQVNTYNVIKYVAVVNICQCLLFVFHAAVKRNNLNVCCDCKLYILCICSVVKLWHILLSTVVHNMIVKIWVVIVDNILYVLYIFTCFEDCLHCCEVCELWDKEVWA